MPPKTKKSKSKSPSEYNDIPLCGYCKKQPRHLDGTLMTYSEVYASKGICDFAPDCMSQEELNEEFGEGFVKHSNPSQSTQDQK